MRLQNRGEFNEGKRGRISGNFPSPSGGLEGKRKGSLYRLPFPLCFPRGKHQIEKLGNFPK